MERAVKEADRRRRVLDHAKQTGNVARICRHFGIGRASFYRWRQEFLKHGESGLVPKESGPKSHPNRTPATVVEQVLPLRRTYHLGPMRIVWYLARYHDIKTSDAGVYRVLKRNGIDRLQGKAGRRAVHTTRYEKKVPGHHIQVDVKFLSFADNSGAAGAGVCRGTQYGISAKSYPDLDIAALSEADARAIYRCDWWDHLGLARLPAPLATKMLDAAVDLGPRPAIACLQRALNAKGSGPARWRSPASLCRQPAPSRRTRKASAWQASSE
ncbi:MAG: helix-turn-helix domain-containing protein [Stellaceae bacterium]